MNRPIGTNGAIGTASRGQSASHPPLARRRLEKTSIYLFQKDDRGWRYRCAISAKSCGIYGGPVSHRCSTGLNHGGNRRQRHARRRSA